MEPFAAAGLAFAGAQILSKGDRSPARAALAVAAGCLSAYLLRPFDWITAPAFVLAALLAWKGSPEGGRRGAWLLVWLVSGLALHGVLNQLRNGSLTDFGYGFTGRLPFVHPLLSGLVGSAVHPGRGLFLYAPIVLAALLAAPRLGWPARLLCFGVPLELVLVSARWYGWHGGSCWGPRYLVPILPLLVAPAVLAPLYGHPWLLANSLAGRRLSAPWLARGARETGAAAGRGRIPLSVDREARGGAAAGLALPAAPPRQERVRVSRPRATRRGGALRGGSARPRLEGTRRPEDPRRGSACRNPAAIIPDS